MHRDTLLLLAFTLVAGCANPGQQAAHDAQVDAAQHLEAVRTEAVTPVPEMQRPEGDFDAATLDSFKGQLRPIDSPLPDRAAFDAAGGDDAASILVALLDDEDALVRQNAARSLGLYPEEDGVEDLLLAMATDGARAPGEQAAAVEGFERLPQEVRQQHEADLAALLRSANPSVAFAAVRALQDLSGAADALAAVAAEPELHPAVRRRIEQALLELGRLGD